MNEENPSENQPVKKKSFLSIGKLFWFFIFLLAVAVVALLINVWLELQRPQPPQSQPVQQQNTVEVWSPMVHQLWPRPITATRWYRRRRKTNLLPSRMRLMIRRLKPLPLRPITNRKRKTTKSKTIRLSRKNYRLIKKSRWSR